VNVIFARLENFQSSEIAITDPGQTTPHYVTNAVTIRKLPEVEFTGRDPPHLWKPAVLLQLRIVGGGCCIVRSRCFDSAQTVLLDTYRPGS